MLNFSNQTRVFLFVEPVDMRKSFRGLCMLAESVLEEDPASGHWFAFVNRRRDRLKLLGWDGQGFWIWYKKLEPEGTRIFGFTEVGRRAYNRPFGVAEARRMVGISRQSGPRRNVMSGQGSPTVPPRALRRAWFDSTNSGRS